MASTTTLLRARVPKERLERAERVLRRLGLKPSDAINMLLAQIDLQKGLPFAVTTAKPAALRSADEQAQAWTDALGAY